MGSRRKETAPGSLSAAANAAPDAPAADTRGVPAVYAGGVTSSVRTVAPATTALELSDSHSVNSVSDSSPGPARSVADSDAPCRRSADAHAQLRGAPARAALRAHQCQDASAARVERRAIRREASPDVCC